MRRAGRLLWWAGPWIGLGLFAWRQQGLEARLAEWVDATNKVVQSGIDRLAAAAAEHVAESEQGVVGGDR